MDRLPSRQVEKLLYRIRDAKGGKVSVSDLSMPDRERLAILSSRGLVVGCDHYFPHNDPGSSVYFVGPFANSVSISTAGMDYLSDLADERRTRWFRFGRDILMLVIGAIITLVVTFFFNKLTGSANPDNHVATSENSPASAATPSDSDCFVPD